MSRLVVYFDGACPLCRREINFYQKMDAQNRVEWRDISTVQSQQDLPLPQDTLMARFHVQRADGQLLSGARAFIELWKNLPGWRWVGLVASVPGAPIALEIGYRFFLRFRPRLQRALK
jgi:predicted DCC family thiol-disulfide oxidoreductase YuxK